jgi:hypothetical protein
MKVYLLFSEYTDSTGLVQDSIIWKAYISEAAAEHEASVRNEMSVDVAQFWYVSGVECEE